MGKHRAEYDGHRRPTDLYELTITNIHFGVSQASYAKAIHRTRYSMQLNRNLHRALAKNMTTFGEMFAAAAKHAQDHPRAEIVRPGGRKLVIRSLVNAAAASTMRR